MSGTELRSADEIAREMVSDDHETSCEESWSTVLGVDVPLPTDGIDKMRAALTAAIEQARADGAADALADALAAQQPRDLAGRIRALTLDWTDRLTCESTDVHDVLALEMILQFYQTARRVAEWQSPAAALADAVADMRQRARPGVGHIYRMLDKAADDLDRIVRECGEKNR